MAAVALCAAACQPRARPEAARPTAPPLSAPAPDPGPALTTLPGFRVERVYGVPASQGSWVSLALDDRGRLLAAAQHKSGLFRVTPSPPGAPESQTRVEAMDLSVGQAHGLSYLAGSVYTVVSEARDQNGLYRLRDTDGDDRFDEVTRLRAFKGNGEHGPHAVVAGPDGKSLFVVGGNFTAIPEGIDRPRVPSVWGDDHLIPALKDPVGGKDHPSPSGWVIETDLDGKRWDLWAIGLRNAYDLAFDRDGELFTYDSDMEWDIGTFWYRAPRIYHLTSGLDLGWRMSTKPWPAHWADTLPPVLETGPASPTGITFGYGAKFPARYQNALYALDWTYGLIYAVHLTPRGGTYGATIEEFVGGKPLPVTDAVVGKDGALYFVTGGRDLPSALYRVVYAGDEPTVRTDEVGDAAAAELRVLRRRLEGFHGRVDPRAIDAAFPQLAHEERFVRHAARLALEAQPLARWQGRALALTDPRALTTAALALARHGKPAIKSRLAAALLRIDAGALGPEWRLDLARAYQLVFTRLGPASATEKARMARQLEPLFPAGDERLDAELARVLAYAEAARAVPKLVAAMEQAGADDTTRMAQLAGCNDFYGAPVKDTAGKRPLRLRMHYAAMLRALRAGWTPELRRRYFSLINEAMARSRGGNAYYGAWQTIRDEAAATLPAGERQALAGVLGAAAPPPPDLPRPMGPGQIWTVNAVMERLQGNPNLMQGRDLDNGRRMFASAACALCHRAGGEGGAVGPDLTGVGGRFGLRELLDSIVNPSALVSDQYASQLVTRKDGSTVAGRVVSADDKQVAIMENMFAPQELTIVPREAIASIEPSPVSQMPPGLLDAMNRDEVLDLLSYLLASGR